MALFVNPVPKLEKDESRISIYYKIKEILLYDESGECIIIDPGCHHHHEQKMLMDFIEGNKLTPVKLINTHCHIDHVLGNAFVAKKYGLELYLHKDELQTYSDTGRWAEMFGLVMDEIPEKKVAADTPSLSSQERSQYRYLSGPGCASTGGVHARPHQYRSASCGLASASGPMLQSLPHPGFV